MPFQRRQVRWFVGWFAVTLAATSGLTVRAQTTPRIESFFPPGAQRGTEVDVELIGEFMPDGCRLSAAGDDLVLQPTDTADRYRFSIAADAETGLREMRLSSVQGASSPFPFVIGELPEVIHVQRTESLPLTLPVTANGRLDVAGDIDEYSFSLEAGMQIVCAVRTEEIRSPVDPVLRLLGEDGKPVASSFPHRSAEALLIYRAPEAGRFTLQLFDFQLAGSPQHVYRLTVTDGPWLDYAFPAGVSRAAETQLTVSGWNLPSESGNLLTMRVPPQSADQFGLMLAGGANRLNLPVGEQTEFLETEPNNDAPRATSATVPATINGRLQEPGDTDVFAFTAKKGEKVSLNVESAALQFPTDLVLSILNDEGKTLSNVDDIKTDLDPSFLFTPPADGKYFVSLTDRSRGGGADWIYRLHLSTALRPDAAARVNQSSFMVHSGQTIQLPVIVNRIDGLEDELEVTALDLPAGVEVAPQPVPAKTPATIQLPFTVAEQTPPAGGLIRIVVRHPQSGAESERVAVIAEAPASKTGSREMWLAISPEIPFTLTTGKAILDAPRMAAFPFPVSAERTEGFAGQIRLVGVERDRRGTVIPLSGQIAAGNEIGTIPLVIQHNVTEGTTHRCRVMGVAEVSGNDGKTYPVFHVAAGNMSMGCAPSLLTLTAEPSIVTWNPGDVQRVEVKLMRHSPMESITLHLAPQDDVVGVECDPVTVNGDQDVAVLTLRFAPEARLPPRTTMEIKAESSRNGLPVYGTTSFRVETP